MDPDFLDYHYLLGELTVLQNPDILNVNGVLDDLEVLDTSMI